jgi:hypothetical protein
MLRVTWFRIVLLPALIVATDAPAQKRPDPRGIYLFPTPASVQSGAFERAMEVKGVDGVAVVLDWSEIASGPRPEDYDFRALDKQIALARARKLSIELVIKAGKGIPEWIFAPPPKGLGAVRLDFVYSHHNGVGPCLSVAMPPPWGREYQQAFADMLDRVAGHLRATGAMSDVAAIKLTGLNTTSEELRLPAQTPADTGRSCTTDSVRIWQKAGYRPALVTQAFAGLAASFARSFPDLAVVLPVILGGGFPPIDDKGQIIPRPQRRASNDALLDALVRVASEALPGRLILQQDFLVADRPADRRLPALAMKYRLELAWQTNLFFGGRGQGAACGGELRNPVACDESSFLKLLRTGINAADGAGTKAPVRFIEVFPGDALAFPAATAAAHAELAR